MRIKWIESNPIGGGYDSGGLAQMVHSKSKNCYGINLSSDYIKNIDDIITKLIQYDIEIGNIKFLDGKLKYNDLLARADISSDIINLANKFKVNSSKLSFKDKVKLHLGLGDIPETLIIQLKKCNCDISKLAKIIKVNSSPFHSIYHEQGHILHKINISDKFSKLDKLDI